MTDEPKKEELPKREEPKHTSHKGKEKTMPRRVGVNKRIYPEGSAQKVFDYVLQKNMDKWPAIDAAYDLLGFAISHAPANHSVKAAIPKDAEAIKELQAYQNDVKQNSAADPSPPEWLNAFLLNLLRKLLTT